MKPRDPTELGLLIALDHITRALGMTRGPRPFLRTNGGIVANRCRHRRGSETVDDAELLQGTLPATQTMKLSSSISPCSTGVT